MKLNGQITNVEITPKDTEGKFGDPNARINDYEIQMEITMRVTREELSIFNTGRMLPSTLTIQTFDDECMDIALRGGTPIKKEGERERNDRVRRDD